LHPVQTASVPLGRIGKVADKSSEKAMMVNQMASRTQALAPTTATSRPTSSTSARARPRCKRALATLDHARPRPQPGRTARTRLPPPCPHRAALTARAWARSGSSTPGRSRASRPRACASRSAFRTASTACGSQRSSCRSVRAPARRPPESQHCGSWSPRALTVRTAQAHLERQQSA